DRPIEYETVGGVILSCVSAGEPEADVKQLFHCASGVASADSLFFVDRTIAQRIDVSRFSEHRLASRAPKAGLVQQGCDIVLIGKLQSGVGAERPFHRD